MSVQIKLYAVSLSALNKIQKPSGEEDGILYWEHSPVLISSNSVEGASHQAKAMALRAWPKELGWTMHSATITPATYEYHAFMLEMVQKGHLTVENLPREETRFFNFSEDVPTDLKPSIRLKGH